LLTIKPKKRSENMGCGCQKRREEFLKKIIDAKQIKDINDVENRIKLLQEKIKVESAGCKDHREIRNKTASLQIELSQLISIKNHFEKIKKEVKKVLISPQDKEILIKKYQAKIEREKMIIEQRKKNIEIFEAELRKLL